MAALALVGEIQQLLDSDLCESALHLAELECRPQLMDADVAPAERLALLRAYCRCLGALKQHRAALRAITAFVASPVRARLAAEDLEDVARDIAQVRWELGEHDLCLAQLRQIPRSHRTAKDIARMARCAAAAQSADAPELYAELLKRQPNAVEAYTYLNSLRATGIGGTAAQRRSQHPPDAGSYHGVASLAAARSMMLRLEYRAAAAELQRLARRHRGNAHVLAQQATCHYMLNEVQKAATLYEMARSLDAALMQEMGVYSGLLAATSRDPHGVYQLGNHLLKTDQARPEGWIAMARYFLARAQTQEALAIVWKAQALAPDCAEAYYAEGEIQMASGCAEEAADVYLKAHELAPSALTYRGIVDAYVQCGKYKEAFLYAKEAAELMPRHALALAAVGGVLSHSAESHDKAVQLLEAALELDPRCTAAIASLASLHVSTQHVPAAIALLEKHLPENESDDMYARYADVLTLASRLPEAAANYSAALSLNPDNERAKTGFDRVDRLMHPNAAAESAPDDEDDIDRASDGQLPPSDIGSHDGDAIDRGAHDFDRSDLGDDIL